MTALESPLILIMYLLSVALYPFLEENKRTNTHNIQLNHPSAVLLLVRRSSRCMTHRCMRRLAADTTYFRQKCMGKFHYFAVIC